MATVIGLVTARGGSQGVPRKNVRIVAGKPLIEWTIEAALKSACLNRVIVSTDCPEIAAVSAAAGADVPFLRPAHLAEDGTTHIEVVRHVIEWLAEHEGSTPDYIMTLQPTSPFRTERDIDQAVALALADNAFAVVSVREAVDHPFLSMRMGDDGSLERCVTPDWADLRRQNLPGVYVLNGAIYLNRVDHLLVHGQLSPDGAFGYVMPLDRSLDIDDEQDMDVAQSSLRRRCAETVVAVGTARIGGGHPCFVIAEAGVNHNGSVETALNLVDAAADAAADAVKFQMFRAEKVASSTATKATYQKGSDGASQVEMLKGLELSTAEFQRVRAHCDKRGILFLASPFDAESVNTLVRMGVPALKVSSGELTNLPFLRTIAAQGLPVILSTGMGSWSEVDEAVQTIRDVSCVPLVLLHCVSCYPARSEDTNLRAISSLRSAFGVPVGLSDHTQGTEVACAAVASGAEVIEKHFTLERAMKGPDHAASLEPDELQEMIAGIRRAEILLGSGEKVCTEGEREIAEIARRSLVACRDIAAREVLSEDMVGILRPGTGLPPRTLRSLLGKTFNRSIRKGELIAMDMFV